MSAKKIIVIGGSAAGPKAAARARRLDQHAHITIIQKGKYLSMASCGYPYYVGGLFNDRNKLISTPTGVIRDPDFYFNAKDIIAKTETEVTAIHKEKKTITCTHTVTGTTEELEYDSLIITTGARPKIPPIPGTDLKGITTLQSMDDADFLRTVRDDGKIKKAVIIGGGLIGIETCEALRLGGIDITIIEMLPQLLTFLDWELAKLVEKHVKTKSANIITNNGVAEFLGENGVLTGVKLTNGTELPCELAVIAIGVSPNTELAQKAGITIGETGGIAVNEYLETSEKNIYAAGDCIEVIHRITKKKCLAPYGDLANLEGRVAGENAVLGNRVTFPGTTHTGICMIFDFGAGVTGLSESQVRANGISDTVHTINASSDKPGFMNGKLLVSKLIADKKSGKLLGYQCVGPGDVSKQIATAAMAIQGGLTVDDIVNADLPYAPPFSLAIDHFIASAQILKNKMQGRLNGISAMEVKELINNKDSLYILDVRSPAEYEEIRLNIGEVLIPLGALRKRLHELPDDKNARIVTYCKISLRGYEAALLLTAHGYTNVKVMEGGIMAWPYMIEH